MCACGGLTAVPVVVTRAARSGPVAIVRTQVEQQLATVRQDLVRPATAGRRVKVARSQVDVHRN